MADMNETVTVSSLRRYPDDTTQYAADNSPIVLQYTLNKDMEIISSWPDHNYLHASGDYTQGMIGLENSSYFYNLEFDGIFIKEHFKILGGQSIFFERTYNIYF